MSITLYFNRFIVYDTVLCMLMILNRRIALLMKMEFDLASIDNPETRNMYHIDYLIQDRNTLRVLLKEAYKTDNRPEFLYILYKLESINQILLRLVK